LSDALAFVSAVLIFFVYGSYFRQTVRGTSTPNPVTWLIWLSVMTINVFTYFTVVGGDVMKTLVAALAAPFLFLIFTYSLFRGKFTRLSRMDIVCLLLAIAVGVFWRTTGDDITTNIMLQLIILISFIPTISGLLRGKAREKPLPWNVAVVTYAFLALSILTDPDPAKRNWVAFMYPVLNGILGNGIVAILAHMQRSQKPG
jgi:hypothetical protein